MPAIPAIPAIPRWSATLAFPLAALVALSSLGGILLPSTYARETASWAAQGIGQDWVDLLLVAPFLILAGVAVRRGSRVFTLLYGGALIYVLYSFVLYAFDMHFNRLFFVYCGTLGLAFFALAGLAAGLLRADVAAWFDERAPARLVGVYLVVTALLFALLWLAEDVPAVLRGTPPPSLAEVGLMSNPVHVIDLSIVLPAMFIGGVALLRRSNSPLGWVLAPCMTTFSVFMTAAIGGMMIAMRARGVASDLTLAAIFIAVTLVSLGIAIALLRHVRPAR